MRLAAIFLILISISGCSTPGALSRLSDLSRNRDEQQAYIKKQDDSFKQLLKDFSSGRLLDGTSKEEIIEVYGEPIAAKATQTDASFSEEFLYRHPAQFFGSEKIFLYFDQAGKLVKVKYEG